MGTRGNSEEEFINGFSYDEHEKKITIKDQITTVIWENVEKNVAEEASKMYSESSKDIDTFLMKHNCKRFWSYTGL